MEYRTTQVLIVMWAYLPLTMALYAILPARRALLISAFGGLLFLPSQGVYIPGPVDLVKPCIVGVANLISVCIFDSGRLARFRPSLLDLCALGIFGIPVMTSVLNQLGAWDGVTVGAVAMQRWTLPYLLGRLYFRDRESLRELAIALVAAALILVPFTLFEVRMSPQWHRMVYGFLPIKFMMLSRSWGWRPVVFMDSPLMLGLLMSTATVTSYWLWRSGAVKRILRVPIVWIPPTLLLTTLLCKTMLSFSMALLGCALFHATRRQASRVFVATLLVGCAAYPVLRAGGVLTRDRILAPASVFYGGERLASLDVRLLNEDAMSARARERPFFGWGGWGRARVSQDETGFRSIVDGYWIIQFGQHGFLGALSLLGLVTGGAISLLLKRGRGRTRWGDAATAPGLVLCLVSGMFWIDLQFNAFVNPALGLIPGALVSVRSLAPARSPVREAPSTTREPDPEPPEPQAAPVRDASLGRGLRGRPGGGRP